MRIFTPLAAIAMMAMSTTAFAGGLAEEVMEAPVAVVEPAPAGSSISPTYIVLGILAALLIASQMDNGEEEDTTPILVSR